MNVHSAWNAGYQGDGVKVALLDTGVDFGHPDLQNTYARDDNPNSPYYGWPLAYDPWSMELYNYGISHNVSSAITGWGSWYIDTSTTVSGATAVFTTAAESDLGLSPISHTYTLPGTSKSGIYHIGIHPDENLVYDTYHEYPAVLVVDAHTAGVYDTVIVDLNNNHDFRDDDPLYKGHEVATRDYNGDGYADRSTGMLYFVADGHTPIPASDWLYAELPPANGSLVAMMGSFGYGQDHGTLCASSIVAQGVIDGHHDGYPPYKPAGVGGMVQGTAPHAKLIAIGNIYQSVQTIYDAYMLMTYGYDGIPGSGDDAQVVSLSFGFSGGADNGWDFQSRYLSALLRQYAPNTAVLVASGNGGPGYGTVTPPATSPYVISVGASTQYGETTTFDPISGTDQIKFNDVQPWSNRGPAASGQPKPDIVSVGAWGSGDIPINELAPSGGHDGWNDWVLWGGTSMSTPEAAGITALLYQAYKSAHGYYPDGEVAKDILKAGAKNLNYDVFAQGAGQVDAGRTVDIAAANAGLYTSPSAWNVGSSSPGAIGFITPGLTLTRSFTLNNPSPAPLTANLGSDNLVATGSLDWSVSTSITNESPANFSRPDYLWNLSNQIPLGTDLVQLTAYFPYEQFSVITPTSLYLSNQSSWSLLAYDWHDQNHDGIVWHDDNHNGVVNDGEYQSGEFNRFAYAYNAGTILQMWVQQPLQRVKDGFFVGLQHRFDAGDILTTTINLKATFYHHQAWPMVSNLSATQLIVPAHGQATFVASFTAPSSQPPGTYEGALTVATQPSPGHVAYTQTIPIAANVVAPALDTTLGGTPPSASIFDSGQVRGAIDWNWRPDSGEWRNFFVNNTQQVGGNDFLWVNTKWNHYPTDIDTVVLGPAPWDFFSTTYPNLFGPYPEWLLGGSVNSWIGGGIFPFQSVTGTTEEWVSTHLNNVQAAHEIVHHNVGYAGRAPAEPFTDTLGIVNLSSASVDVSTNSSSGSVPITLTTGLTLPNGLRTSAFGLSQQSTLRNLYVVQYGTWFDNLTLTNTAALELTTHADNDADIDLFLDRFFNNRWNEIAASTGPSGDEFIRISPALDGDYRIRVDGTNIPSAGTHFDLTINTIGGTDLSFTPAVISGTIPAGSQVGLTLAWNKPGMTSGIWQGQAFLGPSNAAQLIGIPVTIRYGNPTPEPSDTPRPCHFHLDDVPTGYWAYQYIQYLYCQNVVSGYLDNTYRPNNPTSRAEFAKLLTLAEGWPQIAPTAPTFADVLPWSWAYPWVETLAARGVVSGDGNHMFNPVRTISRAEAARMLVKAQGWATNTPIPPLFSDVPPDYWAYIYIEAAAYHQVFSGYAGSQFHPNANITRAEIARVLYRLMQP